MVGCEMYHPKQSTDPDRKAATTMTMRKRDKGSEILTSSHDECILVECVSGLEMEERVFWAWGMELLMEVIYGWSRWVDVRREKRERRRRSEK
jgi:hypothetical protein